MAYRSGAANLDYRQLYDSYWACEDRIGESSCDLLDIAEKITLTCGLGPTLDVGSGEGALVGALLRRGANTYGLDVAGVVVDRCNKRIPGRFINGSVLCLPFRDDCFQTVVSTDCLEHLDPTDVPQALREIYRIAERFVYLTIATTRDRDSRWHLTVQGRTWWESRCLEAGFRKHPAYYEVNDYESLNRDERQITILLEKARPEVIERYPLGALTAERHLHMDMLRESGERSDAHVFRYHLACKYIMPGDRVLDAACGLGYGSHLVRSLTDAASVLGIDESEYAIDYSSRSYGREKGNIEYRRGLLPEALSAIADRSFDVIISFETLEHLSDPLSLLHEFQRLLAPGGRVIISVPNDWSDETGQDPNPYHLHVYDWKRVRLELETAGFIIENAYAQTASQCKSALAGRSWVRRSRSLEKVPISGPPPAECEWWLMTAMKSPLSAVRTTGQEYGKDATALGGRRLESDSHGCPDVWLDSMVNPDRRLNNQKELERLALDLLSASPRNSPYYGAALFVLSNCVLDHLPLADAVVIEDLVIKIDQTVAQTEDVGGLQSKTALRFIKAQLLLALGRLRQAQLAFRECGDDVSQCDVHMATNVTEAWLIAGRLAFALGDEGEATDCWAQGVESGRILLSVSRDILRDRECPKLFDSRDSMRAYDLAWDNIARCASGLQFLRRRARCSDASRDVCLPMERSPAARDLSRVQGRLRERTREWVEARQILLERTCSLERSNADLAARTSELVDLRGVLIERTRLLEKSNTEIIDRTSEIIDLRNVLIERTRLLEKSNADLAALTDELIKMRRAMTTRTRVWDRLRQWLPHDE